jgi:signal peptidase I
MRRRGCIVFVAAVLAGCGGAHAAAGVAAARSTTATPSSGRVYRVPSGSMEPTLGIGARVIVSPGAPSVGEIVVFHPPEVAEQQACGPTPHTIKLGGAACVEPVPTRSEVKFIKRIVAGPGDAIYIKDGHVYRRASGSSSFVREPDPYIRPCGTSPECNFPTPIEIPAKHWYMLGDNRGESDDSRFYGSIPASWIVGVVTACAPPGSRTTLGEQLGIRACKLSKPGVASPSTG